MEILGTIGFIFGVAALAQVTQLKRELAILKAVGKLGSNFSFSIAFIACLEIPIKSASSS